MTTTNSVTGRVAVVTGGARGIGRAIAAALADEGVTVAIGDLDGDEAARSAGAIGRRCSGRALDVTDADGFDAFLDEVEADLGPLDIMVNNAGLLPFGHYAEEPDEMTSRQIDVMLRGTMHGSKQAVRRMANRGTGHIVNISSVVGWMPGAGAASYAAAKFGVRGFSEALKLELEGTGVEISVIAPGIVQTDMTKGVKDFRGVRAIPPEQVAAAVVAVLRRPRPVTFVPREVGVAAMVYSALPHRLRFAITRAMRADALAFEVDREARAEYDARLARGTTDTKKGSA